MWNFHIDIKTAFGVKINSWQFEILVELAQPWVGLLSVENSGKIEGVLLLYLGISSCGSGVINL